MYLNRFSISENKIEYRLASNSACFGQQSKISTKKLNTSLEKRYLI